MKYWPMGYFRVVALYPESIGGKTVYLIDLKVLDYDTIWWDGQAERLRVLNLLNPGQETQKSQCYCCLLESRYQTYQELSISNNPICPYFGTDHGDAPDLLANLTRPDSLLYRVSVAESERPVVYTPLDADEAVKRITRRSTEPGIEKSPWNEGILYRACNHFITRTAFDKWRCRTPGCNFVVQKRPTMETLRAELDKPRKYFDPEFYPVHRELYKMHGLPCCEGYEPHALSLLDNNALVVAFEAREVGRLPGGSEDQFLALAADVSQGKVRLEKAIATGRKAQGESRETNNFYYGCGPGRYRFHHEYIHEEESTEAMEGSFLDMKDLRCTLMHSLNLDPSVNQPHREDGYRIHARDVSESARGQRYCYSDCHT